MYAIAGPLADLFSQAYVVISVWQPSPTHWKAQYHMLNVRSQENLLSRVMDFDIEDWLPAFEPIDANYIERNMVRQARDDIESDVEKQAVDLNHLRIVGLPLSLRQVETTLAELWMGNDFSNGFLEMAKTTKSPELKDYLNVLMDSRN